MRDSTICKELVKMEWITDEQLQLLKRMNKHNLENPDGILFNLEFDYDDLFGKLLDEIDVRRKSEEERSFR